MAPPWPSGAGMAVRLAFGRLQLARRELPAWGAAAGWRRGASSKRKKGKPPQAGVLRRPSPARFQRQHEGDFPVQVRPIRPPDVMDLQDMEIGPNDEDLAPRMKPHRVRAALRGEAPPPPGPGDTARLALLKQQKGESGTSPVPEIPHFSYDQDLGEEDAADLKARRNRDLAKQTFKWMPNPYSAKPGPLGRTPQAQDGYYKQFFDGSKGLQDQRRVAAGGEQYREPKAARPKRERLTPQEFWYQDDHVTPDPPSVALMRARDLKFAMANEAHLVRKWRNEQPEGRAAGLPPGGEQLWMAFGYRAAELAAGKGLTPPGEEAEATPMESGRMPRHEQRCSLMSALRFVQDLASVQAGPFSALQRLLGCVLSRVQDLKPHHCYILLQAMSRLRLRHPQSQQILERMRSVWGLLPPKKFVRTANAVAKLDMGGNIWARPLKMTLQRVLPRLSGQHLALLKAITVMELLDDADAMQLYLEQCMQSRESHVYPRHLQMVELHVHLAYPELWKEMDEDLRLFLQEVRQTGEEVRAVGGYGPRRAPQPEPDSDESDGEGDDAAPRAAKPFVRGSNSFDGSKHSSPLHEDVSRVLRDHLGVEHQNLAVAGPITLDACHLPSMTAVECGARWMYYLRSPRLTALARRRQELIRGMGFNVVHISYHRWETLGTDEEKAALLRERLPAAALAAAGNLPGSAGWASSGADGQRSQQL